jgi:iron-sulfur cluster assembly protein
MLTVSESAREQIAAYFSGKEISPIRIFVNSGSCCGPSMAMALDDPKESDETITINGFTFVVDKALLQQAQPIQVDFKQYGFKIDCSLDFGGGCGSSCSSKGRCGS